ncbi:MAG: CotH kinase family protein [Mariniphaga sp.]|nr:CotH kinase family protein [Mariniphaga sp.]
MKKTIHIWIIATIILICLWACESEDNFIQDEKIEIFDWSAETHSKSAEPDYSVVFPSDKVNRIDIVIDKENWEEMQNDLAENIGNTGGPPSGNPMTSASFDPVWVPCEIFFKGRQWYKVGIRFKGNSSLNSTYNRGLNKFPFKLDFDQFEDIYPEIEDQRFCGFKQLSLKNNFEDRSFLREKVASGLFQDFGLASPSTSFYTVFIDHGDGSVYFGLYTLVEEVDDTVLKSQFSEGNGNLYKPEGDAATFASGSFNTSEMYKKSNLLEDDYSDVQNLYNTLHSNQRIDNREQWKQDISEIFNIDIFLKWLAANTVMQNWDTYGKMSHNFYLYNNPEDGKLTWIPWDNNEALQSGKQGGAVTLELDEVEDNWPLICYIIDDEEWNNQYRNYVSKFLAEVFYPSWMHEIYSDYFSLISNYVVGTNGEQYGYSFLSSDSDFESAIDYLKIHVSQRKDAVVEFLELGE